ncbi:MAG: PilZ domain-containing protein [Candidatus Omnitrophica bacterium]|nr:PilZ domain-containing protein [Candidatus Omnitrophota bacterium]
MEEKRKFIRFKAPFCVQYNSQDSGDFSGVIKDISMGGVRLSLDTSSSVSLDAEGMLSILLPEDDLKITGKVVWASEVGEMKEVGFCFAANTDSGKEQIHQYILKHFNEKFTRNWWQM